MNHSFNWTTIQYINYDASRFEYSSGGCDTGISTIDEIEDDLSTSTNEFQFTLEQSSAYNENIALEFNTNLTYY